MDDLVLCLGVGYIDNKISYAHLLRLDDPMCVLTRRCQKDDEFSIGKWYKEENGHPKSYNNICNFVPTTLIRQIDKNGSGKTTIELVLPVFFVPDLSALNVFGNAPSLKTPNSLGIPMCPFFRLNGNEFISPVRWSYGFCSYSDQLYALKINLSYTVGILPEWTPQNVGIIKPWNYEEYPFVTNFCSSSRDEGIVIEQVVCPWQNLKSFYCCILLNKNAEMSVSIVSEKRKAILGERRSYWRFKLNCYDYPVSIAIDFPQVVNGLSNCEKSNLQLRKIRNDSFELTLCTGDFMSTNCKSTDSHYVLSWLGILMDPFQILNEKFDHNKNDQKTPLKIRIRPNWHLAKWSVAWTVVDIGNESKSNGNDLIKYESNGYDLSNRDDLSPSKFLLSLPSSERKKTVAALLTVRTVASDAVFLFWSVKKGQFTQRCYAKFHKSVSFQFNFGEWFELEYLDIPQNKTQIIVLDYSKFEKVVPTRVRDGLCAQFSTNKDRFLNVWHTVYPCLEKNSYYEDMGWWPWLCRKCFPGLREIEDSENNGKIIQNNNDDKGFGVSAGERFIHYILKFQKDKKSMELDDSFVFSFDDISAYMKNIENEDSAVLSPSLIISKDTKEQVNKIPLMSQQRLIGHGSVVFKPSISKMFVAVLMAVRPNGDSVFLFFDKDQGKFTHRIYSDPPNKITGNPEIGKWYKLEHKQCTTTLVIGQKISISSLTATGNPVETRVKNGILAQFNTKDKFISVWHNNIEKWHNYKASPDGPWWPKLCSMCYPYNSIEYERQTPISNDIIKSTEGSNNNNKPWTDKLVGLIYTESEEGDSDASINNNICNNVSASSSKINNLPLVAYSPPLNQQRKTSSPKTRPPLVSVSGKLYRSNTCSIDNVNTSTLSNSKSPPKLNMFAEFVKKEVEENTTDESVEVSCVINNGGFGSARMRRFVPGGSITSSNTSPSLQ